MLTALLHFLSMHGYAIYIWPSYLAVMIFLIAQWFLPWRRFKKFLANAYE